MGSGVITRRYQALDGTESTAVYSPCEQYRYALERVWTLRNQPGSGRFLVMVMLNPSTATEAQNDPTVQRCETRARRWGFDGLLVLNIFAFRATDPKDMLAAADPVGPLNDRTIMDALAGLAMNGAGGSQIICGWGTHGNHRNRSAAVLDMIARHGITPMALSWTKDGHPQHPLYIGYDRKPRARAC